MSSGGEDGRWGIVCQVLTNLQGRGQLTAVQAKMELMLQVPAHVEPNFIPATLKCKGESGDCTSVPGKPPGMGLVGGCEGEGVLTCQVPVHV